jgi:hypothetical protein
MKVQHLLFSQVALAQDLPEYNLKRGNVATIVEYYPMPEGEEDGYSLEGFDLPHVTMELPASQIIPIAQWQQEEMILAFHKILFSFFTRIYFPLWSDDRMNISFKTSF